MSFNNKIATVFGGTGFVGRQVVRVLAREGFTIKVATRVPARAYFLRPLGVVGQIVPFFCDYKDPASVARAVAGADYVVNCVGILYEKKKNSFQRVHADFPAMLAQACAQDGVEKFVHISSLSADRSSSRYAKTKLAGEQAVLKSFPSATILRPSIIFGEDDNFFNMLASLARIAPALPLIGGGKTKFQPVFVGDVADAVMAALQSDMAQGQVYELGGPETLNFKEIYQRIFYYTGQTRKLISVPWWLAKIQAGFLSLLPNSLLTPDQVESLKTDNIVGPSAKGLIDLGVQQTALELILPRYLERFRAGGRFAEIEAA